MLEVKASKVTPEGMEKIKKEREEIIRTLKGGSEELLLAWIVKDGRIVESVDEAATNLLALDEEVMINFFRKYHEMFEELFVVIREGKEVEKWRGYYYQDGLLETLRPVLEWHVEQEMKIT